MYNTEKELEEYSALIQEVLIQGLDCFFSDTLKSELFKPKSKAAQVLNANLYKPTEVLTKEQTLKNVVEIKGLICILMYCFSMFVWSYSLGIDGVDRDKVLKLRELFNDSFPVMKLFEMVTLADMH